MDRAEFMALESSKKAEVLNALLDEGKNQKEAMGAVGVTLKDRGSLQRERRGRLLEFPQRLDGRGRKVAYHALRSQSDRKRGLPQPCGGPRFA